MPSTNAPEQLLVTGDAILRVADPADTPTMPTSATDNVVESAPWYELGYVTTDGIGYQDNFTQEVIRALQAVAPIRVVSTARDPALTFALMQILNPTNLVLAFGGGAVDEDGHYSGPLASDPPVERSVCLDAIDGETIVRFLFQRTGLSQGSSFSLTRTTSANLSVVMAILDPGGSDPLFDIWTDPESALAALAS